MKVSCTGSCVYLQDILKENVSSLRELPYQSNLISLKVRFRKRSLYYVKRLQMHVIEQVWKISRRSVFAGSERRSHPCILGWWWVDGPPRLPLQSEKTHSETILSTMIQWYPYHESFLHWKLCIFTGYLKGKHTVKQFCRLWSRLGLPGLHCVKS